MENGHQKHMTPPRPSVCSWNERNGVFLRKVVFRMRTEPALVEENGGKRLTISLEIDITSHLFMSWTFLCCLKILLMCLYTLSSRTLQDTSKVWHLLFGGRLINTAAEYITVGMCVMFCQKIQIWFQRDFGRLLASNIYVLKEAVNIINKRYSHRGISLQDRFWVRLSRNESTAGMSFCPASGTHYKWYASATHPLRRWRSATVSWHGADTPSKVGIPV